MPVLNINNGEYKFQCDIPNHGPQWTEELYDEAYEEFWEYHHPVSNDVGMNTADQKTYDLLQEQDKIEDQHYESA